jgi:uncharacterized protein YehS (DUF1456 family)
MTHNDILRQIRYTFDLKDLDIVAIFKSADLEVTRAQVCNWLKKEDDPEFVELEHVEFATFLNGFIHLKRGKKEGPQHPPETHLNNNIIFRKLKIALTLTDIDILEILDLANFRLGKSELSAFFRNKNQRQYRHCNDQILRNFMYGLKIKYKQ